jgi:hypothetical protein
MNEFTITANTEKVGLSLEEESMVFSRYVPRDFYVGLSLRISADILWDLNQLQKRDAFMDELNFYHSSVVGSSLPKSWWFHFTTGQQTSDSM